MTGWCSALLAPQVEDRLTTIHWVRPRLSTSVTATLANYTTGPYFNLAPPIFFIQKNTKKLVKSRRSQPPSSKLHPRFLCRRIVSSCFYRNHARQPANFCSPEGTPAYKTGPDHSGYLQLVGVEPNLRPTLSFPSVQSHALLLPFSFLPGFLPLNRPFSHLSHQTLPFRDVIAPPKGRPTKSGCIYLRLHAFQQGKGTTDPTDGSLRYRGIWKSVTHTNKVSSVSHCTINLLIAKKKRS